VIADQIIDVHERYPEIDTITKRALENGDMAMFMACAYLVSHYSDARDFLAEEKRKVACSEEETRLK
jgi:hypothetical protein